MDGLKSWLLKGTTLIVLVVVGACTSPRNGETGPPPDGVGERTAASTFDTYSNERFGYSVEYPSDLLTSINRSQNGDGAVIASDSLDATLRVSASHNTRGETLVDLLDAARDDFSSVDSEEGRQVVATLRGVGSDGDRRVEHIKLRNDDIFRLELSYPEGAIERSTVDRIVSSFDVDTTDEPTGLLVQMALLDYAASDGRHERESDGTERGCDRVVMVHRNVPRTEAPLTAALEELFALEQETVDGWQNFIAKTNETLSFERAAVEDSTASIYLTGELSGLAGVCDNPRAKIQIEETALQFPTVDSVAIYLNGRATELQPSGRGEE